MAGASIVDARIHTMTNGMALDTFWVQDAAGGAFDQPHRLAKAVRAGRAGAVRTICGWTRRSEIGAGADGPPHARDPCAAARGDR